MYHAIVFHDNLISLCCKFNIYLLAYSTCYMTYVAIGFNLPNNMQFPDIFDCLYLEIDNTSNCCFLTHVLLVTGASAALCDCITSL